MRASNPWIQSRVMQQAVACAEAGVARQRGRLPSVNGGFAKLVPTPSPSVPFIRIAERGTRVSATFMSSLSSQAGWKPSPRAERIAQNTYLVCSSLKQGVRLRYR
ncbi:hypothetical protein BN2476_870009 [Paraburkholderia piptadeniae]|uniref:Uncharacterized protein n=1 Tax=Paraburkholderia piptadeniae TaxID=1701573 RepID=A0A1N7STD3_9BURK|nr:hypothetical protein BN2476_870009 [Paraburkholderia piptadeniae]